MVTFIGAGPGDPDLITVRGLRCLKGAEVIVHDRLVSRELLELAPTGAELRYVGKTPGSNRNNQDEINALLVELGRSGRRVVRLKGGDPFVFGRGYEEIEALQRAAIPYEVVPGLTSAVAVPGAAGIPLTHRGLSRSFAVVTARQAEGGFDFGALVQVDTLVVLMGRSVLHQIASALILAGKSPATPAACIERGTTPDQRVVRARLDQLADCADRHAIESPAIIVIGAVCDLAAIQELKEVV